MLGPDDRSTYLEALRPPCGYRLDRAVGTTFSLDLSSLLTIPLAFATFDWHDSREQMLADPVALLEALRRYAASTTVFCQEGRIALPTRQHPLYAHLESMVVQVRPKTDGVFHPKTWLLRFAPVDEGQPVVYRFLCLSRNLTQDRSWDTLMSLEGELTDRTRAIAQNHPLGDFVAALPDLASQAPSEAVRERCAALSEEVRRVRFVAPEPFDDDFVFHPLGLSGYGRFELPDHVRLLAISPFVTPEWVRGVEEGDNVLVSRAESLDQVAAKDLQGFAQCLVLEDRAEEEERDAEGEGEGAAEVVPDAHGLHAKLFICEDGSWNASVLTGSANATSAGFGSNVEFMVELHGKRSEVGIKAFLDAEGGMRRLLCAYKPGERVEVDAEQKAAEDRLEKLRRAMAAAQLRLLVSPAGDRTYDLALRGENAFELGAVRARCWPITLPASYARDLSRLGGAGTPDAVVFKAISVPALSSFVAFELEDVSAKKRVGLRFVLNLPIDGVPDDRMEVLLRSVLGDRSRLLRYLLFLLADDSDPFASASDLVAILDPSDPTAGAGSAVVREWLPLFEEMVRAVARHPDKLDAVQRLVEDLRKSEEGRSLLPDGFDQLWDSVWAARKEVRS